MRFNVCIIQPLGYIHSEAFRELAELICYGLQDLGHTCSININRNFSDARNIIIGVHLVDKMHISNFYKSSIILNTEQLSGTYKDWQNNILNCISSFEIWDYSEQNLIFFKMLGISNVKFLKIGYHEKLNRINKPAFQDIDILFYGSINERRNQVLNELKANGLNVVSKFGYYGKDRDELISRAKVVLNLHYYDSKIFEIVRVFYLMINKKAVVGELSESTHINEAYLDGFYSASYENISGSCEKLIGDSFLRKTIEQKAFECIRMLPQHLFMQELLD